MGFGWEGIQKTFTSSRLPRCVLKSSFLPCFSVWQIVGFGATLSCTIFLPSLYLDSSLDSTGCLWPATPFPCKSWCADVCTHLGREPALGEDPKMLRWSLLAAIILDFLLHQQTAVQGIGTAVRDWSYTSVDIKCQKYIQPPLKLLNSDFFILL